jgi:hypothetical protein
MRDERTRELFAYWRDLRTPERLPLRSQIDPRAIKRLLPHVFLLERIDRDLVIFRLAGTAICDAYGREFKALNLLSLMQGDSRRLVRSLLDNVVMLPCPGLMIVRAETDCGRVFDCEVLFLPLVDDAGNVRKIIGSGFAPQSNCLDYGEKILRQEVVQIRMMTEETRLSAPGRPTPRRPIPAAEERRGQMPVPPLPPRGVLAHPAIVPEPIREKKHLKLIVSRDGIVG